MDNLPVGYTRWSDRLAMDVALLLENSGETLQEVLLRHKIPATQLVVFSKDPIFVRKVEELRVAVKDGGLTFKLKARAQAEELLTTSWGLIHDPGVAGSVKADLIKSTVKWAGLEPKETREEGGDRGGVTISINLGGQQHAVTLKDITPSDEGAIEHDADSGGQPNSPSSGRGRGFGHPGRLQGPV